MDNSEVVADKLIKRFDKTTAIDGLSLTINRGEIYGLIGRNGAGKTTTFNILSGLMKPSSGTVKIFGLGYANHEFEIRGRLGVMRDHSYLYEQLTGVEYLQFVGKVFSLSEREILERTEELFDFMDLNSARNQLIHEYSKGMKKKLTLASVFLHRPRLMILDEPFEGIDSVSIPSIRNAFVAMKKAGATIVFSTHILEHVERLCTTIGIIENGRLEFESEMDSSEKIDEMVGKTSVEGGETRLERLLLKLKGSNLDNKQLSWLAEKK